MTRAELYEALADFWTRGKATTTEIIRDIKAATGVDIPDDDDIEDLCATLNDAQVAQVWAAFVRK